MQIKQCTVEDVQLLAKLNKLFIEEEDPEIHVSLPHLEDRMLSYINSEYNAFFFQHDDKTVGYALCSKSKTPMYLRQFYISNNERRKGYGKEAFTQLLEYLSINQNDIDVYAWNDSGVAFWRSLGFNKRRYNMGYNL